MRFVYKRAYFPSKLKTYIFSLQINIYIYNIYMPSKYNITLQTSQSPAFSHCAYRVKKFLLLATEVSSVLSKVKVNS